jgi:hypothetical protein
MTPEGRVKARIKKVLERYGVYYFMPVQYGYGPAGVDFHCVVGWRGVALAFFIESKDEDKPLTKRQELFLKRRREEQNAKTFVIDDDIEIEILISWLEKLKNERQSEFRP